MVCRGICHRYGAKRDGYDWYGTGAKRCRICNIYVKWEGLRCPCCSHRLRTTPYNRACKARYRERTGTEPARID